VGEDIGAQSDRPAGMMLAIASTLAGNAQLRGTPQVLGEVLDASRMVLAGQTIILADIVAPVLGEPCRIGGNRLDCGRIARAGLLDLLAGATLQCSALRHGRHRCFADGYDVGFGLIHAGWAVPVDDAPAHYKAKMHEARERGRGSLAPPMQRSRVNWNMAVCTDIVPVSISSRNMMPSGPSRASSGKSSGGLNTVRPCTIEGTPRRSTGSSFEARNLSMRNQPRLAANWRITSDLPTPIGPTINAVVAD
jgi:hypothetical protein